MSKIAWAGELELLEAKWTDRDGHTIKFKLVTPNEERPNPFKAFTKRRGKRGGTRFIASLSHVQGVMTDEVSYNGEFMLAGWSDTSSNGYTVTFWCEAPETGIHAFDGFSRGRDTFMAALVELDENDQPIDQERRDRVEAATDDFSGGSGAESGRRRETVNLEHDTAGSNPASPTKHKPRKLSQYAAMLCQNDEFWGWINDTFLRTGGLWVGDKDSAAAWMRAELGIESRRELDTDEAKAELYHNTIRKPFVAYMEGEEA